MASAGCVGVQMKYKLPKVMSRKRLIKKLDSVFSIYIRQRDKKCVQCGSRENLTCGHLFSRVAHSTRWDEKNCHCQCTGCNMSHEFNPHNFTLWFVRRFGLLEYELLNKKYNTTAKYTNAELQLMILDYTERTKCL